MTQLDIFLNTKFYDKVDALKKRSQSYASRVKRTKNHLVKAKTLSKDDILRKVKELGHSPSPKEVIALVRNIFNSGLWIGTSQIRHLLSLVDFKYDGDFDYLNPKEVSLLRNVQQCTEIEDSSDEEIFKTIYNEMEFSHYYPKHKPLLEVPKVNSTVVLISGVFNEIFSTAAFERAALHLKETHGIKYFTPKVYGYKSSKFNSRILKRQFESYIKNHPEEKLWLVCFSKGGLDALKFLSDNQEFAINHIEGISTIASPILGSEHLDNKILNILNQFHKFSDSKIYKYFDKGSDDLLAKEFQKSLSSTFQRPWLRRNHLDLPKELFYTAVGFESKWYESHLWMMLMKTIIKSKLNNDGVVDAENSLFPYYFDNGINLGILNGHHLIGTRSSTYCQEALLESLIIFLKYKKLIS